MEVIMVVEYWTQIPSNFTGTAIRRNEHNYGNYGYGIANFKNGNFHCEYGPAIVYGNGDLIWAIHGKRMSFEDFFDYQKDKMTEEQLNHILFNLDLFICKELTKEQLEQLLK